MTLEIPTITTEQMVEVDRLMVEDMGIQLIQMMENAGRALAALARERYFNDDPRGKRVLVLAGKRGNGGGGMAAARRLYGWGAEVKVFLTHAPQDFSGVPAQQLRILQKLKSVECSYIRDVWEFPHGDLILDALIGYSLQGAPYGEAARLIRRTADQSAPVLSLDVPSGIEAGTGVLHQPHIQADATLTLALPKEGLLKSETRPSVGELYLADIGIPPEVYQTVGIPVGPIYAQGEILNIS